MGNPFLTKCAEIAVTFDQSQAAIIGLSIAFKQNTLLKCSDKNLREKSFPMQGMWPAKKNCKSYPERVASDQIFWNPLEKKDIIFSPFTSSPQDNFELPPEVFHYENSLCDH
jgi:hypothetical protein